MLRKRCENLRQSNVDPTVIEDDDDDQLSDRSNVQVKYSVRYFSWHVSDSEDDDDDDDDDELVRNITLPLKTVRLNT